MDDSAGLPTPRDDWALFLDVDGTIVGIAETPAAVTVDAEIIAILHGLMRRFGGAVALVSGRPLAELDRLFAPLRLPAGGLHGHERRSATGTTVRSPVQDSILAAARESLMSVEQKFSGVLLEDKGASLALHYRQAPEREAEVLEAARDTVAQSAGGLILLVGKKVAELRQPGPSKGDVIAQFMTEAPFQGRVPVFIGDDVTDEHGFRAVNAMGGHSIRIGAAGVGAARHCLKDVAELRRWLRGLVEGEKNA